MIGIIGGEYFANVLIKEIENDFDIKLVTSDLTDPYLPDKAADCKIIHYIFSPLVTLGGTRTVQALKKTGKRVIVHWIGTDVHNATTSYKSKFLVKRYHRLVDLNLAVSPALVRELGSIGITATQVPLPVFRLYKPQPLSADKKVLVYLPDSRNDFFRKPVIDKVVDSHPDLKFVILPNSGADYIGKENVTCIKWADDMEKILAETSIFIRLPMHDGLPNSVIEALSMGRHVVYSHEFPYCEFAISAEEVNYEIERLIKQPLNYDGSDYVWKAFDKNKIKRSLVEVYNSMQ
jgi:hypothetical protein